MESDMLDGLVKLTWERERESILKQVEYAIATEMSSYARSRAHVLIVREIDAVLKPKIESMRSAMEERAAQIANRLLPALEDAMRTGLSESIRGMSETLVSQILGEAGLSVRRAMGDVLKAVRKEPST